MQISIVGGELFNKGAQAMVFAVVNEVKIRYPNAKIALLSGRDFNRKDAEKEQYDFKIAPWDIRLKLRQLPLVKLFISRKHCTATQENDAIQFFKHSDLVIDVSGYGLSSVFSNVRVASYLLDLWLAKKMARKLILMPQSFGPFHFGKKQGLFNLLLKWLIQTPVRIYAREQAGYEQISPFTSNPDNIRLSPDTVLQSQHPKTSNIFKNDGLNKLQVAPHSVAIIPNEKVFKHNRDNDLHAMYIKMVEQLISFKKHVYLIYHSSEDLVICQKIKAAFHNTDGVILVEQEYNALELSSLISQMDYIIASRYHAVVHAYRDGIPALVLGWAVKYSELMAHFAQKQYSLDMRDTLSEEHLLERLTHLNEQYIQEATLISEKIVNIQSVDLFSDVFSFIDNQKNA